MDVYLSLPFYPCIDALAPRPRARAGTTHSIALTDYTVGETDVDLDDNETVISKRNGGGYTSTGNIIITINSSPVILES